MQFPEGIVDAEKQFQVVDEAGQRRRWESIVFRRVNQWKRPGQVNLQPCQASDVGSILTAS